MQKRAWAQKIFRLLTFFVFFVSFMDSGLKSAFAQETSPTPESLASPTGTQTLIAEIPTPSPINVTYPVHGLKLTGLVEITGSIALEGWSSYELAFAFADDRSESWFVFGGGTNPPGTVLASWKTTEISDGDYNLRLRVFSAGSFQEVFVYGLRVRNYSVDTPVPSATPIPTDTLTPTLTPEATALPTFTPTLTLTAYPTPTALPSNPATLGSAEIVPNLGRGALSIVFLFGVFGLLARLRRRP